MLGRFGEFELVSEPVAAERGTCRRGVEGVGGEQARAVAVKLQSVG